MSKLLKFKQALTASEVCEYLGSAIGEKVTNETLTTLIREGYLAPICGYDQLIIGFDKDAFMELQQGGEAKPIVHSYIGTPRDFGFGVDDVLTIHAVTTTGEHVFFARPLLDEASGFPMLREKYSAGNLRSLDPLDFSDFSFPFSQIYDLETQFTSGNLPAPISPSQKYLIDIGGQKETLEMAEVREITGFRVPFRSRASERMQVPPVRDSTEAPSYKLLISVLLELLAEPSRKARNQSGVIAEVLERYPNTRGLGQRSLETIFAAANKARATQ